MDPLEQKVERLERELAELTKYLRPDREGIRILGKLKVDSTITYSGVTLFAGEGAPTFSAPRASLYARTDGGTGLTIYTNNSSTGYGSTWDNLT